MNGVVDTTSLKEKLLAKKAKREKAGQLIDPAPLALAWEESFQRQLEKKLYHPDKFEMSISDMLHQIRNASGETKFRRFEIDAILHDEWQYVQRHLADADHHPFWDMRAEILRDLVSALNMQLGPENQYKLDDTPLVMPDPVIECLP